MLGRLEYLLLQAHQLYLGHAQLLDIVAQEFLEYETGKEVST